MDTGELGYSNHTIKIAAKSSRLHPENGCGALFNGPWQTVPGKRPLEDLRVSGVMYGFSPAEQVEMEKSQ